MDDHATSLLVRASKLVDELAPDIVEKTMWGSPAGKKRLSKRLAAMLPKHSVYTEPFVGSGAVLFAKEPVPTEAINDADPEIAAAYATIKRLKKGDLERLARMNWTGDAKTFAKLKTARPTSKVDQLHRFLYLSNFAYGLIRGKSFTPNRQGTVARTPQRIADFAPRLRHVKVFRGDYEPVVRMFDAKDAVHFFDPPYAGYNVDVGESGFDEERFFRMVKGLQGNFLITYGTRGMLPGLLKAEGYAIKRVRTPRTIRTMRNVGGSSVLTQLVVSNYSVAEKRWDDVAHDGCEVDEVVDDRASVSASVPVALEQDLQGAVFGDRPVPQEATPGETGQQVFAKSIPLLKGIDPNDERYVLGIVLEPETIDAQGDIYSAEEIRSAAHTFMEEFRGLGLMHKLKVNEGVKILENYLAPTNFQVGDIAVKKGTWLLAVRVVSDVLWQDVQSGVLTGFSIGGSARRVPEVGGAVERTEAPA